MATTLPRRTSDERSSQYHPSGAASGLLNSRCMKDLCERPSVGAVDDQRGRLDVAPAHSFRFEVFEPARARIGDDGRADGRELPELPRLGVAIRALQLFFDTVRDRFRIAALRDREVAIALRQEHAEAAAGDERQHFAREALAQLLAREVAHAVAAEEGEAGGVAIR